MYTAILCLWLFSSFRRSLAFMAADQLRSDVVFVQIDEKNVQVKMMLLSHTI